MTKSKKMLTALLAAAFLSGGWSINQSTAQAAQNYHAVPVYADMETDVVVSGKDAADDPAVWVNPKDPSKSTIIATNKGGGILVYDLHGKELYSYKAGRPNNVDVRYNFKLGEKKVDIVAATDRDLGGILMYTVNPKTGELTEASARPLLCKMPKVYGFSLYHSVKTDKYYAMVVGYKGEFEQYELLDNGNGKIDAKLVRTFQVGSISEGMVADDELGYVYISEENVGVWKYGAEPDTGNTRIQVDSVGKGHLIADVEGLTIYYAHDGKGYLIASSQGDNSYNVYKRGGNNDFIGSFSIEDGKIDGTYDTDGIDVIGLNLGKEYPNGFFIAQDGENLDGDKQRNQNFKLVRWEKIAKAVAPGLIIDNKVNPRKIEKK